jgi:hypothetical protein
MSEKEPIDTTLPWARPKREPLSQVEYERQVYEAMTKPGGGKIHKMSITTPTYEPNRAMATGANDIIQKKGQKQPGADDIRTPDFADRVVVYVVVSCLVLMLSIIGYVLTKLG